MFPRLFTLPSFDLFGRTIGPLTLHSYGVLLALAFLAGLWVVSRQAKKAGLDATVVTDMAVYVLIGGLIGAKLLLLLVEWPYYSKHLGEIWGLLQSGGVFYGGLLGAFPVAWWYARRHKLEGWKTADVLAPGVAIGQAIGRLGCFAAGCCYGRPADVPWAVTFHDVYATRQVGTPIDTPLHPTQLYESAATLAIFVFLKWLSGRKRFDGQVTLSYVFLYAAARFTIEFFRGDASRGMVLGGWLSTSQFIAILMVLAVLFLYPYVLRKEPPKAAAATS
jgi:phosphatidylglycerol:prolipoprotein diacylglycerol transferase